MRFAVALLLATSLMPVATAAQQPAAPASSAASTAFAGVSRAYLDGIARLNPTGATQLGDHRYDDKLPDVSAKGRAEVVAFGQRVLADLARIDRARLNPSERVDAVLLENALRYDLWRKLDYQSWAWDPQQYNAVAGGSLYGLAKRDFAPWPQRLIAASARMEAMPAMLAEARRQLLPARVPKVYAETVAKQNGGIVTIVETMLVPQAEQLGTADRARFDTAFAGLKIAVAEHQRWLDTMLVPQAAGDFRLGAKRYDEMVRFALVGGLDRTEIKRRATAAFADTRAQMYAIARTVVSGGAKLPATPGEAQQQSTIDAALELSYAKAPPRDRVIAVATRTLAEATAFARDKQLMTLPAAPVKIIEMPKFQQGVSVAYLDAPGPLEVNLPAFYAISPIPANWTDAQATSFLREYNEYMLHDLSIHEGVPGHYLQLAVANGKQSPLRAVLASGPFIEGWAVYSEGVMMDAGYLNDRPGLDGPLFKLTVLKMRLRSITNALLDIGIQTEGMTREAAMMLMTKGAFQQESEAAGKWTRASLGAVQLLSYFTGYSEHVALRKAAEARAGKAFDMKRYHDTVLSFGSPPTRFVRALLFDEPIPN